MPCVMSLRCALDPVLLAHNQMQSHLANWRKTLEAIDSLKCTVWLRPESACGFSALHGCLRLL